MMKVVLVVLLCSGSMLVVLNQLASEKLVTRVEYRYIPRELDEYIRESPQPLALYSKDMFEAEPILGRS